MNKRDVIIVLAVLLLTITLPYLLAAMVGGEYVFSGFFLNPTDGNTYLAKMRQGWAGSWQFTLPYTSPPGEGAPVFLFYLFLGHAARVLNMPIIVFYHLMRVISAGLLVIALAAFFRQLFCDQPETARAVFRLSAFGAGLGYLVLFADELPSDLWVAEAYPFNSAFSNPHFPLGLAIFIYMLALTLNKEARFRLPLLTGLGLLLSIIQPFGVVVFGIVMVGFTILQGVESKQWNLMPLIASMLLGGPYLLYQYWVINTHPVLSLWNEQNVTPSPPVWDFVVSFSPALPLAVFGAVMLWREKSLGEPQNARRWMLLAWFVLGTLLQYMPFAFQRRFLTGYYLPVVALAVYAVAQLKQRMKQGAARRWLSPALFGLSLPTNFLILFMAVFSALGHMPEIYLYPEEGQAMKWLQESAPENSIILASPELGNFIPAHTDHRVIYGHPMETAHEAQEMERLENFYSGRWEPAEAEEFLVERGIDYIVYGPRERVFCEEVGGAPDLSRYPVVFSSGDLTIYGIPGDQ